MSDPVKIEGLADYRRKLRRMTLAERKAEMKRIGAEADEVARIAQIASYAGLPYAEVAAMRDERLRRERILKRAFKGI